MYLKRSLFGDVNVFANEFGPENPFLIDVDVTLSGVRGDVAHAAYRLDNPRRRAAVYWFGRKQELQFRSAIRFLARHHDLT